MKKKKKAVYQMSDSWIVGALLTLVGGYLDAYTYIARGGVFANAETGNIVLLGVSLCQGNYLRSLGYFVPIAAFMLGVLVSELIRRHADRSFFHWRQTVVLLEIAAVIISALLPQEGSFNMAANVLIAFVCSLQVQSFRHIEEISCATTMCTGNLRSGTECLAKYRETGDKKSLRSGLKYYAVILLFIAGAAVSSLITPLFNEKSAVFCAVVLLAVLVLMFAKPETADSRA